MSKLYRGFLTGMPDAKTFLSGDLLAFVQGKEIAATTTAQMGGIDVRVSVYSDDMLIGY